LMLDVGKVECRNNIGALWCHHKLPNLIICAQLIEKCEFKCCVAINIECVQQTISHLSLRYG
jgi:hypothetical protein